MFIRHQRTENSLATTQNSLAKFRSFPERALFFHNNSPVTLYYSPATTILNEIPVRFSNWLFFSRRMYVVHKLFFVSITTLCNMYI